MLLHGTLGQQSSNAAQPPSKMVSKGTGDVSPSKQFLRIRPAGGSAKMREPVQVSPACHFVTGAFSASDPHIVEQFISRELSGNWRLSTLAYRNFSVTGFNLDRIGPKSKHDPILNERLRMGPFTTRQAVQSGTTSPLYKFASSVNRALFTCLRKFCSAQFL